MHVSSDILLRTGLHGNPIWNWDIANASKGNEQCSMVLAGQKDLASTCMLCLQIVSVLQLLKTFQSRWIWRERTGVLGCTEVSLIMHLCFLTVY